MNDKIEEIIFNEFQQWVYNDENQAGEILHVIDASNLYWIITEVIKKLALLNAPLSGVIDMCCPYCHSDDIVWYGLSGDCVCNQCGKESSIIL